jgi:hypothetical protein
MESSIDRQVAVWRRLASNFAALRNRKARGGSLLRGWSEYTSSNIQCAEYKNNIDCRVKLKRIAVPVRWGAGGAIQAAAAGAGK